MYTPTELVHASPLEEDLSIVIGGPLFQAPRRAHLTGDALQLVRRRIVVFAIVAWFPLLVLSILDGKAWGERVSVPFLYDIDARVRFLVALPLLILAELVVYQRMRAVVAQFVTLGLVPRAVRGRFRQWSRLRLAPRLWRSAGSRRNLRSTSRCTHHARS
jgi:hypothetical protein